jgi:hypothetical protein
MMGRFAHVCLFDHESIETDILEIKLNPCAAQQE